MGDKDDKWNNYLMVYEPFQNQNFKRRDLSWNVCKKYSNYHLGTFRTQNQYNYKRNRVRDIKSYSKNLMELDRKKIKNNMGSISKKCHPWSDEAMEEERKRQLSDTANKLMSKLKMWNMEKNEKQEENGNSDVRSDNKGIKSISQEGKQDKTLFCDGRRMNQKKEHDNNQKSKKLDSLPEDASQKKTVLIKCGFKNNSPRTMKNDKEKKQNKIQQSLIGELMMMPKQNWKYVLSDPKIHPKIERKMTQVVKENRLLLAQKFRLLAESKINSQGQCAYTKFVDDVGDLIDSDLAVDLCQLPPEVIKQIGDIFQLNIENNLKETDIQESNSGDKNVENSEYGTNCYGNVNDSMLSKECKTQESKDNEKLHFNTELQDVSDPESSIILKDSIHNNSSVEIFPNTYSQICIKTEPVFSSCDSYSNCSDGGSINGSYHAEMEESCHSLPEQNSQLEHCDLYNGISFNDFSLPERECFNSRDKVSLKKEINSEEETDMPENKFDSEPECHHLESKDFYHLPSFKSTTDSLGIEATCSSNEKNEKTERKSFTTSDCNLQNPVNNSEFIGNTDRKNIQATIPNYMQNGEVEERHSTETQTDISIVESDYSETFKKEGSEDKEVLLKEVQMIDDMVHRLNQRRYMIFLKLVGLKSLNTSEHFLKTSLIETVTNGDMKLLKKLGDKSTLDEYCSALARYSPKTNSGRTKRFDSAKRGPKRRPQTKDLHSDNVRTRDWRSFKSIRNGSNFVEDGNDPEK